tara:strand:+ start:1648 stop:2178 length:531 start_codon:yes stop_codon:yes gene_type:complete
MSQSNFSKSFRLMLKHEGGFTQNKKDKAHKEKGSSTNLGVTSKNWEAFTGEKATVEVMKKLTPDSVKVFYKQLYWDKGKCSNIPSGIDHMVFDSNVNLGVSRTSKMIQKLVKAKQDGIVGLKTIEAINSCETKKLMKSFFDARQKYYESLNNSTFIKGWTKRNKKVYDEALELMSE